MPAAVMTQEEADALFDQLENVDLASGDRVAMSGEFEPGVVDVSYPGNLPGKKVRIFDTLTGYSSDILPYMLKAVMKMKRPDGSLRYSRRQLVTPPVGDAWCFLNPNFPDYERVKAAGLTDVQCSKNAPFLSVMHAQRHGETRHADRFRMYQAAIQNERDAEQREFQRMQMEVMRLQLANATTNTAAMDIFYCAEPGCPRFFDTEQGLKVHQGRDHKGA